MTVFVGEVVNIIGLVTLSNVLLTTTPFEDREAQQPNSKPTSAVLNVFPTMLKPTIAWNSVFLKPKFFPVFESPNHRILFGFWLSWYVSSRV